MIKKMLVCFEPTRRDFQFLAILGRTFIHQNEELDKVSVSGLRRRHMLRSENRFESNRLPVKRPLPIEEVLIQRLSKSPGSCLVVRLFQPGEQKRDGLFQPT
jgi:hypothetical protein